MTQKTIRQEFVFLIFWLNIRSSRGLGIDHEIPRGKICAANKIELGDLLTMINVEYAIKWGKSRWGDKTPDYVLYMKDLKKVWPNAQFIHVIRDGRDVALSYLPPK